MIFATVDTPFFASFDKIRFKRFKCPLSNFYRGPNSLSSTKQDEIEVVLDAILNFALYFLFLYTLLNYFFIF
jgi:hypothetical protein